MAELAGVSVFVLGELAGFPRRKLGHLVERAGGRLVGRMSRKVTLIVAAGSAVRSILTDSPLLEAIDRAPDAADLVSERTFKRLLKLLPPLEETAGFMDAETLVRLAGIDSEILFWLELFDVLESRDDRFGYRDLVAAREVARLLDCGCELLAVLEAGVALKNQGFALAEARLRATAGGRVLQQVEGQLVGPDGQLELPLDDAGASPDALIAEAEMAEEDGDLATAERLLATAAAVDRRDGTIPLRLGAVLIEAGETTRASIALRMAIAREPDLAEAWLLLGFLAEQGGRDDEALIAYRTAGERDPEHAGAHLQLGVTLRKTGAIAEAVLAFERCAALDGGEDGAKARRQIAECRTLPGGRHLTLVSSRGG
jgi:tetratricopeptide (TPR) repeat protein